MLNQFRHPERLGPKGIWKQKRSKMRWTIVIRACKTHAPFLWVLAYIIPGAYWFSNPKQIYGDQGFANVGVDKGSHCAVFTGSRPSSIANSEAKARTKARLPTYLRVVPKSNIRVAKLWIRTESTRSTCILTYVEVRMRLPNWRLTTANDDDIGRESRFRYGIAWDTTQSDDHTVFGSFWLTVLVLDFALWIFNEMHFPRDWEWMNDSWCNVFSVSDMTRW